MKPASDIAFTDTVKSIQTKMGSRRAYSMMENGDGWETTVTEWLAAFLAKQNSFYLATVNADGQPYIQHRGGPPGFLRVIDEHTLGFADFAGNRQYISLGNLQENHKVHVFLMDYANKQRIKIWGEAQLSDDKDVIAKLKPADYKAKIERAMIITIKAWDANCPQHIPQKFDADDVKAALAARDRRIAELEAELAKAKS